MALLTYKSYRVEQSSVADYAEIRELLTTTTPNGEDARDRYNRRLDKIAMYIATKDHSYVVRDDGKIYGVVCFDLNDYVELEYLYSTKKHHNVPICLLMNYVLNYAFVDKKVVCESKDVSSFKSIVTRMVRIADYYVVNEAFKQFVKRYEDGQ